MAQANSAQREPSMEEILASIRRIIEDSDTTRKPQELDAVPSAANEAGSPDRVEVDAFRTELGPVAGTGDDKRPSVVSDSAIIPSRAAEPRLAAEEAPKPFRLADVQAQMAREAAELPKTPEFSRPAPAVESRPMPIVEPQREMMKPPVAVVRPADTTPAPAAPQPAKIEPLQPSAQAESRPAPVEHKIEKSIQPVVPAPREPVVPAPREPVVPSAAAPAARLPSPGSEAGPSASLEAVAKPIISQAAGRQVAAAFGQLSEAFALRANKTFDEMAEQMLRPMLQDWLDNNLPVLVERLVREEIERVARGV